ncbi:hypothetical protein ACIRF8_09140 [Streptomyces sp. NPDC102406]|uniref:hypothetical protein n=1 Tax=Streptomyces sp. NPDC102406 TaxID=3366171 RepID=UPI00382FCC7D
MLDDGIREPGIDPVRAHGRWRDKSLTAEFHDRLRDRVRQAAGHDAEPTAPVIDVHSVKAAASAPTVV